MSTRTLQAQATTLLPAGTLRWETDGNPGRARIEGRTTAGSSAECAVRIADPTVSRLHCSFEIRADGVWVRDLGSRNGTMIDGVMIREGRLPRRARLRLGQVEVSFEQDQENTKHKLWPTTQWGKMVGESEAMRLLFMELQRIAKTDARVLIQGPTGTGKELAAQSLHMQSKRADKPFVVFDCAATPDSLFESALFGHERGAFTGADRAREGAAVAADGGVLFLDEVGELSLEVQPKFLRFLQEGTVTPLGTTQSKRVDVRVIAATHRDLVSMVREGDFREDLFYRLAVLNVKIPPLSGRPEDSVLLARHFLPKGIDPALAEQILRAAAERPFPGNGREVRAFVEGSHALGALSDQRVVDTSPEVTPGFGSVPLDVPFKVLKANWVERLEREYMEGMIRLHGRHLASIGEASGLDRSYVHRLLNRHGL